MRDAPSPGVTRPGSVADSRAAVFIAGGLFVTGLAVFAFSALAANAPALRWVGGVFLLAALAEALGGLLLAQHGRSGVAYIMGGAMTVFFGIYAITRLAERPHAIALLLGLYLVMNATLRALELAIERPRAWPTELLYVGAAMILAMVLITGRDVASARLIGACVGIELVARGLALFGAAHARRPVDPVARLQRSPIVF